MNNTKERISTKSFLSSEPKSSSENISTEIDPSQIQYDIIPEHLITSPSIYITQLIIKDPQVTEINSNPKKILSSVHNNEEEEEDENGNENEDESENDDQNEKDTLGYCMNFESDREDHQFNPVMRVSTLMPRADKERLSEEEENLNGETEEYQPETKPEIIEVSESDGAGAQCPLDGRGQDNEMKMANNEEEIPEESIKLVEDDVIDTRISNDLWNTKILAQIQSLAFARSKCKIKPDVPDQKVVALNHHIPTKLLDAILTKASTHLECIHNSMPDDAKYDNKPCMTNILDLTMEKITEKDKITRYHGIRNILSDKEDPRLTVPNAIISNNICPIPKAFLVKLKEDIPIVRNTTVIPVLDDIYSQFTAHNKKQTIIIKDIEDKRVFNPNKIIFDYSFLQKKEISIYIVQQDPPIPSNPMIYPVLDNIKNTKFLAQKAKNIMSSAVKSFAPIRKKVFQRKYTRIFLNDKQDSRVILNSLILTFSQALNSREKETNKFKLIRKIFHVIIQFERRLLFTHLYTIKAIHTTILPNLIQTYHRHYLQDIFHGWLNKLSGIQGNIIIHFPELQSLTSLNSPKSLQKVFHQAGVLLAMKYMTVQKIRKFKEDQAYHVVSSLITLDNEILVNNHDQGFHFGFLPMNFLPGNEKIIMFKEIPEACRINEFRHKCVPQSTITWQRDLCTELKKPERERKIQECDEKCIPVPYIPKICTTNDIHHNFTKLLIERKSYICVNLKYTPKGKATVFPTDSLNIIPTHSDTQLKMPMSTPSNANRKKIISFRFIKPDVNFSHMSQSLLKTSVTPCKANEIFSNLHQIFKDKHIKYGLFREEVNEIEKDYKKNQTSYETQYKKILASNMADRTIEIKNIIVLFFQFCINCIQLPIKKKNLLEKEKSLLSRGNKYTQYIAKYLKIYNSLMTLSESCPLALCGIDQQLNMINCDRENCFTIKEGLCKLYLSLTEVGDAFSFNMKKLISCISQNSIPFEWYQQEIGDSSTSYIRISESVKKSNNMSMTDINLFPSEQKEKVKLKLFKSIRSRKNPEDENSNEIHHIIAMIQTKKYESNNYSGRLSSLQKKNSMIKSQILSQFERKNDPLFIIIKTVLWINLIILIIMNLLQDQAKQS